MKKFIAALFVMLMPFSASADMFSSAALGTKTATFLKMPVSARAIGMGDAFTSYSRGFSDMIYWNPAGIAALTKKEVSFMYSSSFEDITYEWISFALPTIYGTFGAALQHLSYGTMYGKDEDGDPTYDFSPYDLAVYLSYARFYEFDNSSRLDYGLNLKYIYSKIEESASAFAVDAGAIYTLSDAVTSFGAVLQNAGTTMTFNEKNEELPLAVKIGASRFFFETLLLSLDINFPSDNDVYPSAGAEYGLRVAEDADIFFRMGYDARQKDAPGFAGLNAGAGISYKDYTFDYAFSPNGDLGSSHRVSAGIKFGKELTIEEREKLPVSKKSSYNYAPLVQAPVEENEYADRETIVRQQKEERIMHNESILSAVVMDFTSSNVAESERNAFAEMLRKQLYETEKFKVEASVSSKSESIASSQDLKNIFKRTSSDLIILCNASKRSGKLAFDLTIYDSKLNETKYTVSAEDSFRDVQLKFKKFAEKFAQDMYQ